MEATGVTKRASNKSLRPIELLLSYSDKFIAIIGQKNEFIGVTLHNYLKKDTYSELFLIINSKKYLIFDNVILYYINNSILLELILLCANY